MEPYLIAELGINHNGNIDYAKKMILAAHEAGFDAVKFQKRTIDLVYTKEFLDSPRESPWGVTQRAQKQWLEFSFGEYCELDRYCIHLGIDWSASCWDLESLEFLKKFCPPWHKVASPMLGNMPLLRAIAADKKKTFISTGMSTLDEITKVVKLFEKNRCEYELMHCNSSYPMKEEDANLLCIEQLRHRFNCNVGYSGHETSLLKVCIAAVVLGARSIERHITLDRAMYGSDQAASIECHALHAFVETLRAIPVILGSGEKVITESEMAARKKLRVEAE